MKFGFSWKTACLTLTLILPLMHATFAHADTQLVRNPTLADTDANGKVDSWYNKEGSPKPVTVDGQSFVQLQVTDAGKGCVLEQYTGLKGAKQVTFAANVRWNNITPGKKSWMVGIVQAQPAHHATSSPVSFVSNRRGRIV